jgi:acetyl-CoA carboxylase carboxyl transferase subunit alpha
VPIIVTIIGEGGSGGALAISVGDQLLMLQYSIYSVISPEGCASILFKKADRAPEAAEAMKITARDLLGFKLIDEIVPEPVGGAHRDPEAMLQTMRERLTTNIERLSRIPITQLLEIRQQRLMSYGAFQK